MGTPRLNNRPDQILREAARLFAAHGFQATSIRSIAEACSVSEAALYRHFDGKEQIYEAVIAWKAGQHDIAGHLTALRGASDMEHVLRGVARHILGFLESDPELLALKFGSCVESGPAAAVLFREVRLPYIDFLKGEIEARVATGELRPVDAFITSRCFVGMVMDCALSANVWNRAAGLEFDAESVIANNVPIFSRGLQSERKSAARR
jgi:AcrR family transcriptional regulator